jgi:putative MATE family efflux protein
MSKLVTNNVLGTMVKMAIPMLAGTFAMNMYNLTNAYFVSRLGTDPLAAISFTFPVIMLLMFLTRGLGTGAMTLVAHAIGGKETKTASTLTSHAILLSIVFAIIMSIIGILTMKPLFSRLGATGEVLDLTVQYMQIWYLGAVIMVVQMTTSDILIGTGNTKAISFLMVGGTIINVFLDIGLIFGKFGMPRMGIVGAAVATLISQAISLSGAIYILNHRMKLIDFSALKAGSVFKSWGKILHFGVPGALGMILTPISSMVITKMVAEYGNAAVAASGVATRIEMFAFMIPMTVGMSLIPFVAQKSTERCHVICLFLRGVHSCSILYDNRPDGKTFLKRPGSY